MIGTSFLVNYSLGVMMLMLTTFCLLFSIFSSDPDRRIRPVFTVLFSFLFCTICANLALQIVVLRGSAPGYLRAAIFLQSLFSGMLLLPLTDQLYLSIGERKKKHAPVYAVRGLCGLYAAMLASTFFSPFFYSVSADGVYRRGPGYPLLLLPPAAALLLDLIVLLKNRKKIRGGMFAALFVCVCAPFAGALAQMRLSGATPVAFALALAASTLFCLVLVDQARLSKRRQEELIRQRTNVMVLQMRPHFIYNSMSSIYYLIGEDPALAQQVTLDFTNYLRRNFSAVAQDAPIPFREELEHARAYLSVVRARFADNLFVEFDTPAAQFRLPPLTLQPLVENAVKYGVDPEMEPLHIKVITRELDDRFVLRVEDTGPGFAGTDETTPPGALDNIRERLRITCGGTLTVAPRDGGGTVVTVDIPKKK